MGCSGYHWDFAIQSRKIIGAIIMGLNIYTVHGQHIHRVLLAMAVQNINNSTCSSGLTITIAFLVNRDRFMNVLNLLNRMDNLITSYVGYKHFSLLTTWSQYLSNGTHDLLLVRPFQLFASLHRIRRRFCRAAIVEFADALHKQ